MRLDCEIISQDFLPALRAVLAKELAACGMSQKEVAEILGISQPAVSQYLRDLRGAGKQFYKDQELMLQVREVCRKIKVKEIGTQQLKSDMYFLCETAMAKARSG